MTALKTTSLRLRGTSVDVLNEEGVDSEGAVTSKSKLQSKVKALSGVDILTESGDYKSTYQILSQIADVWEDINNMDQAALLELLAGKRNASVLAAILQAPEELKAAYEDAQNAEGSALKENEKYMDSIQGRIDQFNNAVQTMWANTLDDDVVKWFVTLGQKVIQVVDFLGLIPSVLLAISTYSMIKNKTGPIEFLTGIATGINETAAKAKTWVANTLGMTAATTAQTAATSALNAEMLEQSVLNGTLTASQAAQQATTAGLVMSQTALTASEASQILTTTGMAQADALALVAKLNLGKETQILTAETLAATMANAGYSVTQIEAAKAALFGGAAAKKAAGGFAALWSALWPMLAITGAILLFKAIADAIPTVSNLEEEFEELQSELNTLESELDSLNSELKTTQDRMEELLGKDSLSFTEEEELNNLKLQNELLEKQIQLQEMLIKSKQKEVNDQAEEVIDASWNSAGADKAYYMDGKGEIHEDKWNKTGEDTKELLDRAIFRHESSRKIYMKTTDVLGKWKDGDDDYNRQLLKDFGYDSKTVDVNDPEYFKQVLKENNDRAKEVMEVTARGINMVLQKEMARIPEGYEYGSNDAIDAMWDEINTYKIKFANAQGASSKSPIIDEIFSSTSSKELQQLKIDLDEIVSSEDDVAVKTTELTEKIKGAYEKAENGDEAYARLKNNMDILGMSAEDLAESFIAASNAPDINTIGGALEIFADGEEILNNVKNGIKNAVLGTDEEGLDITWDNLFKEVDGEKVADNLKIAAILEGADEDVRNKFTKIAEEVENGKMSIDQAMSEWEMAGIDKMVDALNNEFESLNNEMFPDAADEISGLIDTLGELKAAFESVANTTETYKAAQEELNEHGSVSIKTALELLEGVEDYSSVLELNGNQIRLKAGAEDLLFKAQLNSLREQTKAAADLAEAKYYEALQIQQAKEAKDADAKSADNLTDSENNVNSAQQSANKTTAARTGQLNNLETQTDNTTLAEVDYANNDTAVKTAESEKAKAIGLVSAMIVGLDAAIQAFINGKGFGAAGRAFTENYNATRDVVLGVNNIGDLERDANNKRFLANLTERADTYGEFSNNYDHSDKDSGDEETAFEKMQARHEREIAALEHQQELIQGDIDILEAQRKGISSDYYEQLIAGENSKIDAYERQLAEAKQLLAATSDTDEEYNDIVEHIWDIEKGLQDATIAAIEHGEAMNENFLKSVTDIGDAYDNIYNINDRQRASMELYKEGVEIGGGYVNERWYDDMIAKAGEAGDLARQELQDSLNAIDLWRNKANPFEEGTAEFEAWEYDRNTKWQEAWDQAADAKDKIQEMDNEALQLAEDKKDAYIEAWENVATGFERIGTLFENQISLIDGYESRLEALNINVPDSVYDKKAKTQQDIIDNLDEEIAYDQQMLEEYATKYGTDDERYLSKREELDGKLVERYEAQTQLIEIEQQIIDNQIDRFNQTIDRMNDAIDKMNNIKNLVSDEDVANEDGTWTAEGLTQAGMNFQEMAYQKEIVSEYTDEMEELTELYEEGKISEKEYYEQMKELEDGQWSAIEAYKQMEDAIVDLAEARIDAIEDGLKEEIDAYAELIELKKEELDAERDLFEFRRDIEDQSKNIAEIERRIASLSGSSSNEDRAEMKRLQKELSEANRGLDDTYRNHSYDQTSQALDEELEAFEKNYEDYIQGLRDEIKNTDELIKQVYADVVGNGQLVLETLVQLSDEYGFTLDENLTSPWENANGKSLDFEEAASRHYTNVKNTVENGTAGFVENIEKPWKRGQKESALFAQNAETNLQSALTSAQNKQKAMTDATAAPWLNMKELIDQGPTWVSTAADEILKRVRKNVEEINAEYAKITNVGAQLSGNIVTGGGGGSYSGGGGGIVPGGNGGGTYNTEVANLQKILNQFYGRHVYVSVNGVYDTYTKNAVKKMQEELKKTSFGGHVSINGLYDKNTKDALQKWLNSQNVSSWFKKNNVSVPAAMYAKGTLGTTKDEWAITDEPQYGDELVLVPSAAGNLSFMRKGTGVVPADLTKRIMEIAQMPASELGNNIIKAVVPNIETNTQSVQVNFEALVKAEHIDSNIMNDVEKMVEKQLNNFTRNLNYAIKKYK